MHAFQASNKPCFRNLTRSGEQQLPIFPPVLLVVLYLDWSETLSDGTGTLVGGQDTWKSKGARQVSL